MTIYWHQDTPTMVVQPAYETRRQVGQVERIMNIDPVLLRFQAFLPGQERQVPAGLPFRHGLARGYIETKAAIESIKMQGLGFYEGDKDITEEIIEEFLSKHKKRDVHLIQVNIDGGWIPRQDATINYGRYECKLCNQFLVNASAFATHEMSPPHLQKELAARDLLIEKRKPGRPRKTEEAAP